MAKIDAPLLSLGATGTIGGTMTFGSWKGIQYARQRVDPANPRTAGQVSTRNAFSSAAGAWRFAPTVLVSIWQAFAQGRPLTPRNAFTSRFIQDLRGETTLAPFTIAPGVRGAAGLASFTASPGTNAGEVDVNYTLPGVPSGWTIAGLEVIYVPTFDPTSGWNEPISVETIPSPSGTDTLTGLDAGNDYTLWGVLAWTRPDGRTAWGVSTSDEVTVTS